MTSRRNQKNLKLFETFVRIHSENRSFSRLKLKLSEITLYFERTLTSGMKSSAKFSFPAHSSRIASSRIIIPPFEFLSVLLRVDTPSRCIVRLRGEEFSESQPPFEREEERERPVLINFSILARSRYDRLKLIPTPGTDASPLKRRDYARRVADCACRSAPSRAGPGRAVPSRAEPIIVQPEGEKKKKM